MKQKYFRNEYNNGFAEITKQPSPVTVHICFW